MHRKIRQTTGGRRAMAVSFALAAAIAAPHALSAADWAPTKNVEIVVGAGPGTGTDNTARAIQHLLLEKMLVPVPINVVNKAGGGGNIGFTYLSQQASDPHYMVLSSYNLLSNQIIGRSKMGLADFTPLALLFNEYVAFVVKGDSPIKSAKDLADRIKKDPQSITFATSAAVGSANHVALAMAMKGAGVDVKKLKVVIYESGGKSLAAVMGGHVDVVVASSSIVAGQAEAGIVRILGNSSPQRLGGSLAKVPTLTEQGVPVVVSKWRVLFAPKALTHAQTAFWDRAFGAMVKTEEWKSYLAKSYAGDETEYMNSAATARFLNEQQATMREVLSDLGLAKTLR